MLSCCFSFASFCNEAAPWSLRGKKKPALFSSLSLVSHQNFLLVPKFLFHRKGVQLLSGMTTTKTTTTQRGVLRSRGPPLRREHLSFGESRVASKPYSMALAVKTRTVAAPAFSSFQTRPEVSSSAIRSQASRNRNPSRSKTLQKRVYRSILYVKRGFR